MIQWIKDFSKWVWYYRWLIWHYVWRAGFCVLCLVALLKEWVSSFQMLCLSGIFFMLAYAILHWKKNDNDNE